mmetsp:Transcript_34322/g.67592  ORF Transcript_34322/g.67592 Transcript_34322/m.67592 type:complete len:82 (-) Transcript_34322:655-900(-)
MLLLKTIMYVHMHIAINALPIVLIQEGKERERERERETNDSNKVVPIALKFTEWIKEHNRTEKQLSSGGDDEHALRHDPEL